MLTHFLKKCNSATSLHCNSHTIRTKFGQSWDKIQNLTNWTNRTVTNSVDNISDKVRTKSLHKNHLFSGCGCGQQHHGPVPDRLFSNVWAVLLRTSSHVFVGNRGQICNVKVTKERKPDSSYCQNTSLSTSIFIRLRLCSFHPFLANRLHIQTCFLRLYLAFPSIFPIFPSQSSNLSDERSRLYMCPSIIVVGTGCPRISVPKVNACNLCHHPTDVSDFLTK